MTKRKTITTVDTIVGIGEDNMTGNNMVEIYLNTIIAGQNISSYKILLSPEQANRLGTTLLTVSRIFQTPVSPTTKDT